jgi:hypothetical protein
VIVIGETAREGLLDAATVDAAGTADEVAV